MNNLYKYRNSVFFGAAIALLLKGEYICGLLMVLAGIVLFKLDLGECKNNACFTYDLDIKGVSIVISCILATWLHLFKNTSATDAVLYVAINSAIQVLADKYNCKGSLVAGSVWIAGAFYILCHGSFFEQESNIIPITIISEDPRSVSIDFGDLFYSVKDPRLSDYLKKSIMF